MRSATLSAALAAGLLGGCSLRDARNSGSICSGECRPTALSVVSAEVRPPGNSSPFAVLQKGGINLSAGLDQNLALTVLEPVTGLVTQLQDTGGAASVANATLLFTDHAPPIPGRVQQVNAATDAAGSFSVRLPRGSWDVLVTPPPPAPPFRSAAPFDSALEGLHLTLPAGGTLLRVQGTLTASSGEDLSGASLLAVDAQGNALSATATVGSGGAYALLLPPGTSKYFVEVGASPSTGSGTSGNLATLPSYDKLAGVPDLLVQLPEVATLRGTVVDTNGTPLPGVAVFARSANTEPWTLARSTVADAAGAFTLQLRAGNYMVEAAPPAGADQPAISAVQTVTLSAAGQDVQLSCPRAKVSRRLDVLLSDGEPAGPGFQITATLLGNPLLTTRSAVTTPTDAQGRSTITGDPGLYRLEINPPTGTVLAKRIAQITLDPASNPSTDFIVPLAPSLLVTGLVHGSSTGSPPDDSPVGGATVSFFGADEAGNSVVLCSATADFTGRYHCVLPDANP